MRRAGKRRGRGRVRGWEENKEGGSGEMRNSITRKADMERDVGEEGRKVMGRKEGDERMLKVYCVASWWPSTHFNCAAD